MRVLQLNIWARSGPYRDREPRLRQLFADLAPDLIAMQEVDAGEDGGNQAEELLDGLGYEVAYERREGSYSGDPGIAVASRFPIRDRQAKDLSHDGPALATRIDVGKDAFWFCSTVPMPWMPGYESEREDECLMLDEWLTGLADGDTIPPILAGDFDATPDAASIRFLTGRQSLQARSTYWTDAFAAAGDGSPGYTWTTDSPYVQPFVEAVFAEPTHHRRIDYVFVGSPFRWKPRLVVSECRVVGAYADGGAPSDHYGVLAEIELDGDRIGNGGGLEAWDETKAGFWESWSPDRARGVQATPAEPHQSTGKISRHYHQRLLTAYQVVHAHRTCGRWGRLPELGQNGAGVRASVHPSAAFAPEGVAPAHVQLARLALLQDACPGLESDLTSSAVPSPSRAAAKLYATQSPKSSHTAWQCRD